MKVSLVIRCASREQLFEGVLDCLLHQTVIPRETLIVMDSKREEEVRYVESRLRSYPNSRLLTFNHEMFSHPYSANLGIAASKEDLVCITNGHALPTSMQWLEHGLQHFTDERVAGVGGFFYPSQKGFATWLFHLLEVQLKTISWLSTINCIVRKSRWQEYPFDENLPTIIPEAQEYGGEDYDWTLEMANRGHKIVLDPKFTVVHAHERDIILESIRNLHNYFIYRKLREKIKRLQRPRESSTRTVVKSTYNQ